MDQTLLIRAGALYIPVVLAVAVSVWRKPRRPAVAGILLASLWNAETLLTLNVVAVHLGWWNFHASGGTFLRIPLDLLLGWVVLWGVLPILVFPKLRIGMVALLFLALDLLCMPRLEPVVTLGRGWLWGEAVGLLFCLVPSLALARWTRDATHLYARVVLQVVIFSGLIVGLLPSVILSLTGGTWTHLLTRPTWKNGLFLQLLAVPALLGLSAVYEFARRGQGTPLPYDPPVKLVTSGPYAYLANPMQISATLMLAGLGAFLGSLWVTLAGVMAHIYSAGLAAWDESEDVSQRFGANWQQYRANVRNWAPRWRPWHRSSDDALISPARLYVAETCGPCSEVKQWFEMHGSTGLEVIAAERHPSVDLTRVIYDPCDGSSSDYGVAAIARGLGHIHLGWAFIGWFVGLPGVIHLAQLLADASGAGPRVIARANQITIQKEQHE
jgi:protein-S-isoprenylcysteine O-methyltransferase Ste14